MRVLNLLHAIGRHAPIVLFAGIGVAVFLPGLSAALRPALPALVVLVLAVAVARVETGAGTRSIPANALRAVFWVIILMPVTALCLWAICRALGASDQVTLLCMICAAAPPISSAANLCLMLGYRAGLVLATTVLANLATPFLGPLLLAGLTQVEVSIDPAALALRLAAVISLGLGFGFAARRLIGADRIARHKTTGDGLAVLAMLLFVIPLFDGFAGLVLSNPARALGLFGLALALNLGLSVLFVLLLLRSGLAGMGVAMGNRTVALYLATLPPDPVVTLFVALYQFPMYATPLVLRALGLAGKGESP